MPEHVVFRKIDDAVVALNLDSGQYYTLNEVGSRMWILLDEQRSQESIVDDIVSEYDVAHENVERDLLNLLEDLKQNDLVEESLTLS